MTIEDIKRLPTTYETSLAQQKMEKSEVKSKEAKQQHTMSVTEAGKSVSNSEEKEDPAPQQYKPEDLTDAIDKIQDHVRNLDRELQFAVDNDTGTTVVTIRDAQTQEVLRQIPSEELLELSKSLEHTQGVLFNREA